MLGWMRNKDWKLPRAAVAPYFTRSAIDGATPERASRSGRVRRLVFFGRLEERKGIAPFIAALNGLDPDLVAGLRLVFLGRETPHWPAERSEEHTSELQSRENLVCRLLLEKKKKNENHVTPADIQLTHMKMKMYHEVE